MPTEVQQSLFGEDFHPLNAWLDAHLEELSAGEFYRELFPEGSLEAAGEEVTGKYRGVAVRIKDGKARRFSISDGLEVLENTAKSSPNEFWLASPVSYAGRTQKQSMARFLYAVAIDLDGIRIENPHKPRGLEAMWNQMSGGLFPTPTFIVSSGNGLHLYYLLEQPLALYRTVVKQLHKFRHDLIKRVWNSFITEQWEKPQYESVTQGFRMVGTCTKNGGRVRAWRVGAPVSIEYLNDWVKKENQITEIHYKSDLTLADAKTRFPDWYQRRIIEGRPRGSWQVSRALYDWWKTQKLAQATLGHRYFYLMALAIFAVKCGIDEDELLTDALALAPALRRQDTADNPLTDDDVLKALEMYNADYQTFPRRSLEGLTGIPMPPNKRNKRKQPIHLKGARAIQAINDDANGTDWRYHGGAPTKRDAIKAWRVEHPNGKKIECERELGISRHTVLKWWDA